VGDNPVEGEKLERAAEELADWIIQTINSLLEAGEANHLAASVRLIGEPGPAHHPSVAHRSAETGRQSR
jgi:hypothetical protein